MEFIQNTRERFDFLIFFEVFEQIPKTRMYFCILVLFCTINPYFEYRLRILWILLYMGTYFKHIFRHFSTPPQSNFRPPNRHFLPEVWTIFVSMIFFFFGLLVLTGPLISWAREGTVVFFRSCSLPYVIYYFIFDSICHFINNSTFI